MSRVKYKTPAVKTYSAAEIVDIVGPIQSASLNVEGWRGTKLEQPSIHEYRLAENKSGTSFVRYNIKGRIKNA